MAGPICGNIEMFIGNTLGSGSAQSLFVSIYRFLNDNTGTLGIQRLAYNTGSQNTGMAQFRGMNYFDEANPAGDNAWACFRFLSASVPFDFLIQWAGSGNALGAAPGSPALANGGSPTTNLIAFAIAQNPDGTTAWNGTTLNNGSDVKGTIVWASSSISSTVYYPRSNDAIRGGAHGTNRQNMFGYTVTSNQSYRAHVVADYDNIAVLFDSSADNTYNTFFFGKYTPISGVVAQVPYFCFYDSAPLAAAGTVYGGTAGTATAQGGISYPTVAISGTCNLGMDRMSYFIQTTTAQPNRAFATPRWDENPIYVGLNENPVMGLLGQHTEMMREVYNIAIHDTNGDGTRAVFGGSTTVAALKYTLPWHSGTVPGAGLTRGGVRFSIP